jgi:predicted adenylyl cyclase CyaB
MTESPHPKSAGKRHRFFLSPYENVAFAKCPKCGLATRIRETPFAVHVDPDQFLLLDERCRHCPRCDLIIARQSEIESDVTAFLEEHRPEAVGKDYLVLGTLDRRDWWEAASGNLDLEEARRRTFEFEDVWRFEPSHGRATVWRAIAFDQGTRHARGTRGAPPPADASQSAARAGLGAGSNIEVKARAPDFEKLKAGAEELSGGPGRLIEQEDVFFRAPKGRLKLRILSPSQGELIAYERDDDKGPKSSDYSIVPTSDPALLKSTLSRALDVRGTVRKKRLLYLVGQTRIHLDEVEDLGRFVELEVVLQQGQSPEEGTGIAQDLMGQLGIRAEDLEEGAYIDLLMDRQDSVVSDSPQDAGE